MARRSAGLLLYRRVEGELQVLLVHPGGPFWANRDAGAWSIPKGEYEPDEAPDRAALREFQEETGIAVAGKLSPLGDAVQPSRKIVTAYALESDIDIAAINSNTFEIEWPPRSGRRVAFPEVDRAGWFNIPEAALKILPGQAVFLARLSEHIARTEHGG